MTLSLQKESLPILAPSSDIPPAVGDNQKFTSGSGCLPAPADRVLLAASYCLIGIGLLFVFVSTAYFGAGILGYPSVCSSLAAGDAMFPLGIASLLSASRLLHPASQGTSSMSPGISYELKFGPLAIKV